MRALGQFLGSSAGLSADVITKLTETWKAEQRAFAARDLSAEDYNTRRRHSACQKLPSAAYEQLLAERGKEAA